MTAPMERNCRIIDLNDQLYKFYHAIPVSRSRLGHANQVIRAVINKVAKLQEENLSVIVVGDSNVKSNRSGLDEAYKDNRNGMPPELHEQEVIVHALLKSLGAKIIVKDGVEADDVIYWIAKYMDKTGDFQKVIVETKDKDMTQFVTESINILNSYSNKMMGPEEVKQKFGVYPDKMVDYLALTGDKADNIDGATGPKTALKWLDMYGSALSVKENEENITGTGKSKLKLTDISKNIALIDLSIRPNQLTMIEMDVVNFGHEPDYERAKELCSKYGINIKGTTFDFDEKDIVEPAPVQASMF